ncbi:MAG TPA: trypsin-like peptidase domain-containing protein [Terriglobales bacterium]|nr:trypsin-like peptidase domain-containing protein [Terriglobales bacterium]
MCFRVALRLALFALAITSLAAQTSPIKVTVHAALYDRDLNLKPVPHLDLSIVSLDQPQAAPISLQTTFDGVAQTQLTPGRYRITAAKPTEFQGKSYTWELEAKFDKPENVLELSNDNAKTTDLSGGRGAKMDELADHFKRLKTSVVTVWTQEGHGTGFVIDSSGLIVTNQHVIANFTYLAVQFDGHHKVAAEMLFADPKKDVAVLRANLSAFPDVAIAAIAQGTGYLLEGERVFTIGNPLNENKVLTTGIVSKVDKESILSDININPGNSGGPLFNSSGMVVGITTYRENSGGGAGLAGIVPIQQASEAITEARQKATNGATPSPHLLPVIPEMKYPAESLRALSTAKWDKEIYYFKLGEFEAQIVTPVSIYSVEQERTAREEKERAKRAKKSGAPSTEEHQSKDYESGYDPVIVLLVRPRLRTQVWKSLGQGVLSNGMSSTSMHFKEDFLKMRLLCADKEIEPILPGRYALRMEGDNGVIRVNDATYEGNYEYLPDSISPECKQVNIEIFSVKEPDKPLIKTLDVKVVQKVWDDFEPYRKAEHVSEQPTTHASN